MDIKNYILSGAIESYVLGIATPEEMLELETMANTHAEVKLAIASFEELLEQQCLSNAVPPPSFLKEKVMAALQNEALPQAASFTNPILNGQSKPLGKIIPINTAPKGMRWLQGAIAASIILLLGSAILNFYFYSQYRHYSTEYKTLLAQHTMLTAKADILEASYKTIKNPEIKAVPMNAVANKQGLATVYWDKKSAEVWLMVNNLPQTPNGKQYQLWAIVDGKPVDGGIIDLGKKDALVKMKNMSNAQAFAITLEKTGGNPTPTPDQMFVLGKI